MYIKQILSNFLLLTIAIYTTNLKAQKLDLGSPESVGMSHERIQNLTRVLNGYVENKKLAGAVALIARRGKIIYFEPIGQMDIEKNIPMSRNTIFRIASQTKAIVSVGVMMLQEEGKILISDPVGDYIPEFKETTVAVTKEGGGYIIEKAKRPITIRDLLTHTAGIGYGDGVASDIWEKEGIQGWYFAHKNEPVLKTVKRMGHLPFDAQPGKKYVYGYNTDILGALIEVVSGQTLEAFLQKKILNPLGMKDTHFYLPQNKVKRLATVYSSTPDGDIQRAPDEGTMISQGAYINGPRVSFSGGAGYLSTAIDYAVFLQMMLNKGVYDGKRILSRKSVELMTTNHLEESQIPSFFSLRKKAGTGFGLGFSVVNNLGLRGDLGSKGEYEWGGAYSSIYWVDPKEELIVVYFSQLLPALNIDDHGKLRTQVYQSIVD